MSFKFGKNENIETIIGPETQIEGSLQTGESLRIDGKVNGDITAEAIVIGDHGAVIGNISANRITIAGKVKGNVTATTTLELLGKSQLLGDIKTAKLIIIDGAQFEGQCQTVKTDGKVLELSPQDFPHEENQKRPRQLKVVGMDHKE
ncbi:MAG: polymer-forming cytoskeletal protein [Elusimicrobiota bacterium]